jgi:hypothetical protein
MSESPLHDAAVALLPTAPIAVVKQVLRLLLEIETPATPPQHADARTLPTPSEQLAPQPRRKRATQRPRANGVDHEWEQLRRQVRTTMRERGTSYADVAAAVGCAAGTAKVSINRRLPASGPVQAGLRAWLANGDSTQEAAKSAPAPFRGHACGNGSSPAASHAAAGTAP